MIPVQRGDIYFTKADGLVGLGIREVTTFWGHRRIPACVNHVGVIVDPDTCVEALTAGVIEHSWSGNYRDAHQEIAVFRPKLLSFDELALVAAKARSFVGDSYGYDRIVAQLIGKPWLPGMGNHPICSVLAAASYEVVVPACFGVPPNCANPADIWDAVTVQTLYWECVYKLSAWEP